MSHLCIGYLANKVRKLDGDSNQTTVKFSESLNKEEFKFWLLEKYCCFWSPNILAPIAIFILLTFYELEADINCTDIVQINNFGVQVSRQFQGDKELMFILQTGLILSGISFYQIWSS